METERDGHLPFLLARWFAELFFDPEDGGDMFLRKSGTTQRTTRRHIPEEDTLQNHRCENLKSYMVTSCLEQETKSIVKKMTNVCAGWMSDL
jgi:hypothetical protein